MLTIVEHTIMRRKGVYRREHQAVNYIVKEVPSNILINSIAITVRAKTMLVVLNVTVNDDEDFSITGDAYADFDMLGYDLFESKETGSECLSIDVSYPD